MDKATKTLKKTRTAFLWTCVLRAPFWAIFNLLLIILYKDLHATPFQIALFIALRPIVSIFSIYWGAYINQRPDRLLSNIIWAGIIGYFPFLLFPFFYSPAYILFSSALYMIMFRGVVPAWMEVFKLNLPGGAKHQVFSFGSVVSYAVGIFLPFVIGPLMDSYFLCWRWIFAISGLLGIAAIFFQLKIPIEAKAQQSVFPTSSFSFKNSLLDPWKSAWKLFSERRDFRLFQIGFMIFGGSGLMLLQPALPKFFIDILGLSYTELSIALTLCKGIGFSLFSPLWAKAMPRVNIYRFSAVVTFLGFLFPLILLAGQWHVLWIYVAYFAYGIMQAGSELGWHLSGPFFAKEEDSSLFSNLNVLTVGLRGCVVPQVGSALCLLVASPAVLLMSSALCLLGVGWLSFFSRKEAVVDRHTT